MIVTKIENPKKSATKAQRVSGLADYITAPENTNAVEKCVHSECLNFVTNDYATQKMEMLALADEAIRSKDTIDHWVISWQPRERPTIEQARQAVEIFMRHAGLKGHQCIWGLHDDTESIHVHVEINRVHQDTLKVIKINKGFWKEAGQQVAVLIEHEQGWQGVPGARYEIENGKPKKRDLPAKGRKPDSVAANKEIQTGEKSAKRIGIEDAAPIIAKATSWRELHASLAAIGMEYRREGSGAKVYIGDIGVKASDVDRKAAFGALQKRLGQYQPAKEISKDDYHHHTPQPHPAALGEDAGHGLRTLSECRLAHSEKGEYGRTNPAGILQVDARPDRQASRGVRRDAGRGRSTGVELKPAQPGWKEYAAIRDERQAAKARDTATLKAKHEAERKALFEAQKAERKDTLGGINWRGKGDARNAIQSVLAVQHAVAKAELQAQQRAERQGLQAQFAPLPQYKAWAEQPRIVEPLPTVRATTQPAPSHLAATLRALTHTTNRYGTTYQVAGRDAFRDEGATIKVLDIKSDAGIAAALATAQAKYGSNLTLTGPAEFQRRAVAVAVANGLTVKFVDPALDKLRQELQAQKYQAERDTAKRVAKPQAPQVARPGTASQQTPYDRVVAWKKATKETLKDAEAKLPPSIPSTAPAVDTPLPLSVEGWLAAHADLIERKHAPLPSEGKALYVAPDGRWIQHLGHDAVAVRPPADFAVKVGELLEIDTHGQARSKLAPDPGKGMRPR